MSSVSRKLILKFCLCAVIISSFSVKYLFSQTGGTSAPEVLSFSNATASDMVDLRTGDFELNIPIFEVPGRIPYPINLKYIAGISHDQPASWVGLGWNLNSGVILRVVNGAPDDYQAETNNVKTYHKGSGSSFTLGAGPVSYSRSSSGNNGFSFAAGGGGNSFAGFVSSLVSNLRVLSFSFSSYKYQKTEYKDIGGYLHFESVNAGEREHDRPDVPFIGLWTPPTQPQDKYIVNGPGPSGKFWPWRPLFYISQNISDPAQFFFANHQGDGAAWDYNTPNIPAQKIVHNFDSSGRIKSLTLWDVDGTRYIYSYGVDILEEHSRGESQNGDHVSERNLLSPYPYAWYLTAILSNDFVDNSPVFGSSTDADGNWLGLGEEDYGDWVYFTYAKPVTDYYYHEPYTSGIHGLYREVPYMNNNTFKQKHWGRKEIAYPKSIETPTHKAEFAISTQLGGKEFLDPGAPTPPPASALERTYKLDNIKLFAKSDLVNPIKRVEFSYDYELRPGTPNSTALSNKTLALKDVKIYGSDGVSSLPGYSFDYGNNQTYGDILKFDRWGYHKSDGSWKNHGTTASDVSAWSLEKVTYPTGGSMEVVYESDSYYAQGATILTSQLDGGDCAWRSLNMMTDLAM